MLSLQKMKQRGYEILNQKYTNPSTLSEEYREYMDSEKKAWMLSKLGLILTDDQKREQNRMHFNEKHKDVFRASVRVRKGMKIGQDPNKEKNIKVDFNKLKTSMMEVEEQVMPGSSGRKVIPPPMIPPAVIPPTVNGNIPNQRRVIKRILTQSDRPIQSAETKKAERAKPEEAAVNLRPKSAKRRVSFKEEPEIQIIDIESEEINWKQQNGSLSNIKLGASSLHTGLFMGRRQSPIVIEELRKETAVEVVDLYPARSSPSSGTIFKSSRPKVESNSKPRVESKPVGHIFVSRRR
eukprot:TRINITY_DN4829_c0_g1_i5.p1 TRINITY_DN4829_c0_g1~~TRINITY_DN4829_c0_g1_i5.p1  ORF type:complete len:294 (+),score=66.24 TRINITY_DN4829_c0_g1_i5:169-1050(+)